MQGTVLPPAAYVQRFFVPSRTEPGVRYTVEQDGRGRCSCDCPAKDFPKTAGRCWHLKACQAGVLAPVARVVNPTHATMYASAPITVLDGHGLRGAGDARVHQDEQDRAALAASRAAHAAYVERALATPAGPSDLWAQGSTTEVHHHDQPDDRSHHLSRAGGAGSRREPG